MSARGVAKRYCRDMRRSLAYGLRDIWRDVLPGPRARPALRKSEFWVLDDIDFDVRAGEAVALVGANGAGKTTLMRMIAGVLKPDVGQLAVAGNVSGVIELGGGLDPLLTGRENAAMGLRWRGVGSELLPRLVADVQDFAELDEGFDAPVRTYSSGMRSRLAFAITTRVPCDLLLLDEVLAVGDIRFQRKCLRHIRQHVNGGGAMIFVSHNIFQVQAVCTRALVLEHGRLTYDGDVVPALERMFAAQAETPERPGHRIVDPAHPVILGVVLEGMGAIHTGEPLAMVMELAMPQAVRAKCIVSLWSRDLAVCIANLTESPEEELPAGESRRVCRIPRSPLAPGTYAVRAVVVDPDTNHPLAMFGYEEAPAWITVQAAGNRLALARAASGELVEIDHHWDRS